MMRSKRTQLKAFGLGMLFLFMLIPAHLLHDHGTDGNDHHQDLIQVDCSLCDLVLPVQLNATGPVLGPIRSLITISFASDLLLPLEGAEVLSFDRGPPFLG